MGFVFYGFLKKKRVCNEGNDEIGEQGIFSAHYIAF